MRDFLRFFLSAADQARVKPGSLSVSEGPLLGPGALEVSFTVLNPAAGAPQIRPLFPGPVTFLADPAAPGVLPEPTATDLTAAGFATWRTRGTLRVKLTDIALEKALRQHGPTLEVQPNVAFYSPVQLSRTFLLTSLASGLRKGRVGSPPPVVKPTQADWPRHAVSRFLRGLYHPVLGLGPTAADDDVIVHDMPTTVMSPTGQVTLRIVIALTRAPQDGPESALTALAPGIEETNPRHPGNAPVPARHVYRALRPHLLDAAAGTAVPDTCLAAWPAARRYFPFLITRTWQQLPNFSVLFPPRTAQVKTGASTSLAVPVPAHGVVYVPQDPGSGTPPATPTLSLTGFTPLPTTFLAGSTPRAWKVKSDTAAVPLSTTAVTHVILRRPLREEILADTDFRAPGGERCTYMSLRRATRAFVDHRVTGGRLVHEGASTTQVTKDLMTAAWPQDPSASTRVREALAVASTILVGGRPVPTASPGQARLFEQVWIACFPEDVPAHDIDGTGSLARTRVYSGGQMFYALWQSLEVALRPNGTKRNFSNDHVGAGAPGAIVAIGLSSGYITLPPHVAPSPTAAELAANLNDLLTRLTPGAPLQFWTLVGDYRKQRSRIGKVVDIGHSPIFLKYRPSVGGTPDGIVVIDQSGGNTQCPAVNGQITWKDVPRGVWIAAQWDD